MGNRINSVMQNAFFALSGVFPREEAIEKIKSAIRKTYSKRGDAVVRQNFDAVDQALYHLHEVAAPAGEVESAESISFIPDSAPEFIHKTTAEIIAGRGDLLPVSAMP